MFCPLCEKEAFDSLYVVDGYPLVRCAGCGLVRVREIPHVKVLDDLYSEAYFAGRVNSLGYLDYAAERAALAKGFRMRLRHLKSHAPVGRLLDVGCALGSLLAEAAAMGWEPNGVDRVAWAIEWARKNLGFENLRVGGVADSGFEDASFDAVTMIDVLEHFTDPVAEIQHVARLMKPGAVLLLDTWDIGSPTAKLLGRHWPILKPPDHLFFFDRNTIIRLMESAGLRVEEIRRMGRYMPPVRVAAKLPETFPLKNAVIRLARDRRIPIPINLHDNLIVIARRGAPESDVRCK